ncbi:MULTISPECIES: glycoside hydrolase family 19 protein [Paraburkholderia]|uniref:glycoside hydrolase family 19 protein n=1 Tax=Paraburkholderia TaxID=1822464 RepID=UPI0015926237|nr:MULTISPECIES: glycoside hydrolase family 19 protein [Paraburkholderia]MDR6380583.1 putative chitinase [Paraburkholderia caribensis]
MDSITFMAATGSTQANAALWLGALQAAMDRFQINTPPRRAAFLAQVAFESGRFPPPPVAENFNYSVEGLRATFRSLTAAQCASLGRQPGEARVPPQRQQQIANLVYGGRYGNGPAATGDGWKYRGSGLIQLTFKDNFARAGQAIGADLAGNPDLVRNDPATAALVSAWYWQSHGCNELADANKFTAITAQINPAHAGETGRLEAFQLASNALNVSPAAGAGGTAVA